MVGGEAAGRPVSWQPYGGDGGCWMELSCGSWKGPVGAGSEDGPQWGFGSLRRRAGLRGVRAREQLGQVGGALRQRGLWGRWLCCFCSWVLASS